MISVGTGLDSRWSDPGSMGLDGRTVDSVFCVAVVPRDSVETMLRTESVLNVDGAVEDTVNIDTSRIVCSDLIETSAVVTVATLAIDTSLTVCKDRIETSAVVAVAILAIETSLIVLNVRIETSVVADVMLAIDTSCIVARPMQEVAMVVGAVTSSIETVSRRDSDFVGKEVGQVLSQVPTLSWTRAAFEGPALLVVVVLCLFAGLVSDCATPYPICLIRGRSRR